MTHYDSYGRRDVYVGPVPDRWKPEPRLPISRYPERRYLLWINYGDGSRGVGFPRTFSTLKKALRVAARFERRGYGTRIADREILPGDTGFLADGSGSYLMTLSGQLVTGTFEEIQRLRREGA